MSNTKSSSDVAKFEDVRHILGDLHSGNPNQGSEDEISGKETNARNTNERKRKLDNSKQGLPKKRRFCWDDKLHYQFLEFVFKYGVENISSQKVYDVLRTVIDGLTFEFVDNYMRSLRANLSQTLRDFRESYQQAIHYQGNYSLDGSSSRFSVYPFPPIPSEIHNIQPTLSGDMKTVPISVSMPPMSSMSSISSVPSATSLPAIPSLAPYTPLPAYPGYKVQSTNPPAQPQSTVTPSFRLLDESEDNSFPLFDFLPSESDAQMNSQFQLQRDMLLQNDFMFRRTMPEENKEVWDDSGLPEIRPLSSEQDDKAPLSSLLIAPTTYLRDVDAALGSLASLEEPKSVGNPPDQDIFDFLK